MDDLTVYVQQTKKSGDKAPKIYIGKAKHILLIRNND